MDEKNLKFANLKVGLTVFIGIVILFLAIFLVGTEGNYFTGKYSIKMFVTDIEGLSEGSLVSLGGLKIGSVSKMEFINTKDQKGILISLRVNEKHKQQITGNSTAEIKTIGLLGDKFINITIGSVEYPPLKDGDFIKVKHSPSLSQIGEQIDPVLADLKDVTANLKKITGSIANGEGGLGKIINNKEFGDDLEDVLSDIHSFTAAIKDRKGSLGKFLFDEELYSNTNGLVKNLRTVSDSITNGNGTIGKLLADNSLYDNLNKLSQSLNNVTEKLSSDSTFAGGLFNDKEGYRNFSALIISLDSLVTDLKAHPDRYVQVSVF